MGWKGCKVVTNDTFLNFGNKEFDFIPETVAIYSFVWLALVLTFLLFRKNAFNFMSSRLYKFLHQFFEDPGQDQDDDAATVVVNEELDPEALEDENTEDAKDDFYYGTDNFTKKKKTMKKARKEELERRVINSEESEGILSWFKNSLECLMYSDMKMASLAGEDAVDYLRLQRYLIGFLALLMTVSMAVILPTNMQGNLYQDMAKFAHATTTTYNLEAR